MATALRQPQGPSMLQVQINAPYDYLILDIETANGSPEDAERHVMESWRPKSAESGKGCWGDDTLAKRLREALDRAKEMRALLDTAPVISITLKSESEMRCLHCMKEHEPKDRIGALVEGFGSMEEMLRALIGLMAARVGPDTIIAGHNIKGFDLRKLRWAMAKYSLPLPGALLDRDQAVFDIMQEFCSRYSINREIMVSLASILQDWGIESHKKMENGEKMGAMIPELYAAGQFDTIIDYGLLDVIAEEEAFLRMIGRARPTE